MKTLKEDRLMNAISRFRHRAEEFLEDKPFDPSRASGRAGQDKSHMEVNPDSPFEALLDERQKETRRELEDIKGRVNSLVFMILGAILVNLLIKLMS
ncbi:MAG: hypothetical protein EXR50_07565 [Dehalococcoidia bacterium]|nr:hypothetical protein [Dehalococcoidia bacterium]